MIDLLSGYLAPATTWSGKIGVFPIHSLPIISLFSFLSFAFMAQAQKRGPTIFLYRKERSRKRWLFVSHKFPTVAYLPPHHHLYNHISASLSLSLSNTHNWDPFTAYTVLLLCCLSHALFLGLKGKLKCSISLISLL